MSADQRAAVKAMYPGSKRWAARVAKMSDGQVFAIYQKEQAKQAKKSKKPKPSNDIPF